MRINNSIFKLMVEKSVSLQVINEMKIPTSTNLNGNKLPLCFQFVHEKLQERDSPHKLICYLDLTLGKYTCKHLDFLTVLRFSLKIKTFCLKTRSNLGKNFLHPPKIGTPAHLCIAYSTLLLA